MKLSNYKKAFHLFSDFEAGPRPDDAKVLESVNIGTVSFEYLRNGLLVPDHLTLELIKGTSNRTGFYTLDNPTSYAICIQRKDLELPDSLFKALIAHEVGHYIDIVMRDFKPHGQEDLVVQDRCFNEKQLRMITNYKEHSLEKEKMYEKCYLRSVLSALMRGGCLAHEVSADTYAMMYVAPESLIGIHVLDFSHPNAVCRMEKMNRVAWLNSAEVKEFNLLEKLPLVVDFDTP